MKKLKRFVFVVVVKTIKNELTKAFQPFGCETSSKTLCEEGTKAIKARGDCCVNRSTHFSFVWSTISNEENI